MKRDEVESKIEGKESKRQFGQIRELRISQRHILFELTFKSQTFLSQEQIFFGLFLRPTNQPTYLSNYSDWSNFFPMTVNSQLEMWNHIRGGCNKHLNLGLVPSHGEIMFGCLET